MTEATASSHLSIGEVLSLVQEDFPDVTISKIRFLESQGLIAPERTGSGYRKFYEADIDRLRWILRQQRDHFLPLKVIKKMLDEGVDLHGGTEAQPTLWSSAETLPAGGPAEDDAESGDARRDGPDADPLDVDDEARRSYRSPSHPAVASAAPRRRASAEEATAAARAAARPTEDDRGDTPTDTSDPVARDADAHEGDTAVGEDDSSAAATDATPPDDRDAAEPEPAPAGRPAHSTPADVVAALQEDPRSARRAKGRARPEATGAVEAPSEEVPVASSSAAFTPSPPLASLLSADELCELCGITPELLAGLEQFGLVVPASLGGRSAYDADAVDVARIAARYVELGVEPRHLRMYKVAAEREAGFVEQLVVPLIKQRNPAARQQANERADDLITMGAHLHAALLRRQLGRLLGS